MSRAAKAHCEPCHGPSAQKTPLQRPHLTNLLLTSDNQLLTQGLALARPKLDCLSLLMKSDYVNCSRGSGVYL